MKKKLINELYPRHGKGHQSGVIKVIDATGKCIQCGKCCTCITLSTYKNVLRKWVEENRLKDVEHDDKSLKYRRECLFIINNFVRVSKKECKKRKLPLDVPIYWCKQLERLNGKFICKSHKCKPAVCRDYPKYGKRTRGEITLNVGCGYLGE
jgi:Fe-S-cluster containining protein